MEPLIADERLRAELLILLSKIDPGTAVQNLERIVIVYIKHELEHGIYSIDGSLVYLIDLIDDMRYVANFIEVLKEEQQKLYDTESGTTKQSGRDT